MRFDVVGYEMERGRARYQNERTEAEAAANEIAADREAKAKRRSNRNYWALTAVSIGIMVNYVFGNQIAGLARSVFAGGSGAVRPSTLTFFGGAFIITAALVFWRQGRGCGKKVQ